MHFIRFIFETKSYHFIIFETFHHLFIKFETFSSLENIFVIFETFRDFSRLLYTLIWVAMSYTIEYRCRFTLFLLRFICKIFRMLNYFCRKFAPPPNAECILVEANYSRLNCRGTCNKQNACHFSSCCKDENIR